MAATNRQSRSPHSPQTPQTVKILDAKEYGLAGEPSTEVDRLAPPASPCDLPPPAAGASPARSTFFVHPWFPILLAILVRVPGIARPLLGHFATKNVTYAMIARNWVMGRASFWQPTMDCMAGGGRGWHLLELPVSAYLAGAGWSIFGGSLDVWGRAISIAFSAGAVALMFALVRRWHGPIAACGASIALALSPSAVIFGQSFMLEAPLVFFSLASFFCLERWLAAGRRAWLALAATSFMLLLLTKIYMLVLALPLAALVWRRLSMAKGDRWRALIEFVVAGLAAVAPAALWYAYVWQIAAPGQATSAHVFYSVRQSAAVHHWPHPLLASPDFYRRLLDELAGWMLTPIGLVLALAGLWHAAWRRHWAWLAASGVLVAALPSKFYELAYYDLTILPPLCVLAGLGWQLAYERIKPGRVGVAVTLALALAFSFRYAAHPAFATPAEDRAVLAAATALRQRAAPEEPIATLHGAASDLLYYCDRPGWAFSVNDGRLDERLRMARRRGARWLVVADLDSALRSRAAAALTPLVLACEGEDFRIYELSR